MIAAERLGATQAKLLHYANSGDTTGDHSRVVGYGAVALVKAAAGAKIDEAPFSLSRAEKDALIKIARNSVETSVREASSTSARRAASRRWSGSAARSSL